MKIEVPDASRLNDDQRRLYDCIVGGGRRAVYWAHRRAGKTSVAYCVANEMVSRGQRVLLLEPAHALAEQAKEFLSDNVAVSYYGELFDIDLSEFDGVIFDEPSLCGTREFSNAVGTIEELGLWAAFLGTALEAHDNMAQIYDIGVEKGWLCLRVPMLKAHALYRFCRKEVPTNIFNREMLLEVGDTTQPRA